MQHLSTENLAVINSERGLHNNMQADNSGRLSLLEQLPVEILQKIFLLSGNADYARASPKLLESVGSDRLKEALTMQICTHLESHSDRCFG